MSHKKEKKPIKINNLINPQKLIIIIRVGTLLLKNPDLLEDSLIHLVVVVTHYPQSPIINKYSKNLVSISNLSKLEIYIKEWLSLPHKLIKKIPKNIKNDIYTYVCI